MHGKVYFFGRYVLNYIASPLSFLPELSLLRWLYTTLLSGSAAQALFFHAASAWAAMSLSFFTISSKLFVLG